ncbi:MAG: hypothetical protein QJR07_11365 [Acetobacteraceae bacterium]|nr:hypothetical protein [Acetobacteraceae bacterium]
MANPTIRIHFRRSSGEVEDGELDFDLSSFCGILPSIGDKILDPGVPKGQSRCDPANRRMWTVVGRVFNPRDRADYVVLVVDERIPTEEEQLLVK